MVCLLYTFPSDKYGLEYLFLPLKTLEMAKMCALLLSSCQGIQICLYQQAIAHFFARLLDLMPSVNLINGSQIILNEVVLRPESCPVSRGAPSFDDFCSKLNDLQKSMQLANTIVLPTKLVSTNRILILEANKVKQELITLHLQASLFTKWDLK